MQRLKTLGLLSLLMFHVSTHSRAATDEEIFEQQKMTIAPSGELIAVYWFDSITVFDLITGDSLHRFDTGTEDPFVFTFSADSSKLFASGWESVSVWDIENGKLDATVSTTENAQCGGFSKDLQTIYFDDEYNQFGQRQLVLTDKALKHQQLLLQNSASCNVSSDQSKLAVQTYQFDDSGFSVEASQISVIDLDKSEIINTLVGDQAEAYDEDMFFFDENRRLLVRDYSDFHIWDLEKNTLVRSLDSEMDVDETIISGNVVLLTDDRSMRIWELQKEPSQIVKMPLPTEHNEVLSASLSNSGQLYAVTSFSEQTEDVSVTIVETQTNAPLKELKINVPGWKAHFTSDDSLLVLENYPIQVIDVATGSIVHEFSTP